MLLGGPQDRTRDLLFSAKLRAWLREHRRLARTQFYRLGSIDIDDGFRRNIAHPDLQLTEKFQYLSLIRINAEAEIVRECSISFLYFLLLANY